MTNKVVIGYVDDQADLNLTDYLDSYCNKNNYTFTFIEVKPNDNFDNIISQIKEENVDIAVLDSKLYSDHNAGSKITGEELEMLLINRLQFVSTFLISQEDTNDALKCIKKYNRSIHRTNPSTFYEETLKPLLDVECNKIFRFKEAVLDKMASNSLVDKVELDNIESLVKSKEPELLIKKEDVDKIIDAFNKLLPDKDSF